jgi:hypothetical protein
MFCDDDVIAQGIANDASLSLADIVGMSNGAKAKASNVNYPTVNASNVDDDKLFANVGDAYHFHTSSQAFKDLKKTLRMKAKCAPDDGAHDKVNHVSVWHQRRAGKAKLASRAKLAKGMQVRFQWNDDYSECDVTRIR